jgi:2',3'-cyclic-nucleotide 2'-phosphodiesterase (5'-nucleotidase family)
MPTFTLIHTNDFHNHLLPDQAKRLGEMRAALGDNGLLLDAGDAISSGNVTYKPGGEPILDVMSDVGYDAMTIGNREFHFSQTGFCAKVSRARFPVLCANVRAKEPAVKLPVVPAIHRTLSSGAGITVFGLTVPMITERMLVRKVSAYVFADPLRVAGELIPKLRAECDFLVCLSHIGLARDRELAARVAGIDLIIGGHTHALLESGEQVGNTLIVQAGWWGKYFGLVSVGLGEGAPKVNCRIEAL